MRPPNRVPSLARRAGVSLGLCAFFLVVYQAGLAWAAGRPAVPSFYFGWERRVPLVPAAIVPYMSVDLFFVLAPLVVRTGRELRAYAVRMATALAVAGVCFVLLPMRFAFTHPPVPGVLGWILDAFQHVDRPFNQLPSLHVATLLIAGDVFVRHTRSWRRAALLAWFGLIGVSPLLVWQHHVVDLFAGLALGLLCLQLVRDDGPRPAFERNPVVATCYLAGGVGALVACLCVGRPAWPLWWPTLSLLGVAAGYAVIGPAVYAKRDGRLGWGTRVLFGPTLLGQRASALWYARQGRAYDPIADRVWIGRRLSTREAAAARAAGVGAVVDLTSEFTEPAPFRSGRYLHVPTLDLTAPTPAQVDRAVAFVRRQAADTVVLIHCKAGYSRTAVVAAAYLLATGRAASAAEAIGRLREARPSLVVRPEARLAIEAFARRVPDAFT